MNESEYTPPFLSSPLARWALSTIVLAWSTVAPFHLLAAWPAVENVCMAMAAVLTAIAFKAHAGAMPSGVVVPAKSGGSA